MSNIKILDVFGQFRVGAGADSFSSGSAHQFIFPRRWEIEGDWKVYINDVRTILNDIPKCYASWCNNEGWWIATIVKNEQDARQGYAIISVCLGNNLPQYGLLAIRMLDSLASEFMNQNNWTLGELRTEEILTRLSNDIELGNSTLMKSTYTQPTAVRRYKSEAELHELFGNLAQPYHKRYSRILYVADSLASSLTANSYQDVTNEAISKGYEIKCAPADGKVSATRAMKGDEISLTFKNIAEMPETVTFVAGQDTPYATYDENVITIKKHNILRLIGESYFSIRCVDETGKELKGWTATPRTSTVALAIDGDKCLFPSGSDKQVQIGISLQGYQPATIDAKLPNISSGQVETVTLKRYASSVASGSNTKLAEDGAKKKSSTGVIIGIAVVVILLFAGVGAYIIFGGSDKDSIEVVAENIEDSNGPSAEFNNDLEIFKINSGNINKKDLQSEEFKALIDYIATGNTAQIIEQMERCYGQINGNGDINSNLREIYSNLTKLSNAGEQTKVGRFASLCQDKCHYNDPKYGTAVNLSKLNEGLKNIINPPITPPVTPPRKVSPSPEPRPSTPAQRPSYEPKKPSKKDSNRRPDKDAGGSGSSKKSKSESEGYKGGSAFKKK